MKKILSPPLLLDLFEQKQYQVSYEANTKSTSSV